MASKEHWEHIYATKPSTAVSWYAPHLERSLAMIESASPDRETRVVDVGGGASTLVDDLLGKGYRHIAVMDLSGEALAVARRRLGPRADEVTWIEADVTSADLAPGSIDLWHDRAVFHFLTEPTARARYVEQVQRAVRPGGHVIVATFGPAGPERCSGLDIVRYDADGLHAEFGATFAKVQSAREVHATPWGSEQEFLYCYCVRLP